MRLQGKTALVTGAASGFGRGIAETFAREGARVAIVDLNAEGAREVAGAIGGAAIALTCDVSKAEDVNRAVEDTRSAFGGLDIVVNNAANPVAQPLGAQTPEAWQKSFDVNLRGPVFLVQAALPHLAKAGYSTAFQLEEKPLDRTHPLLTLRRALAVSTWTGDEVVGKLQTLAKA